ncbi:MAG: arylsulfatase [Planctomycetota bacterium]|jgi:arylsulfatase A-like enzyme
MNQQTRREFLRTIGIAAAAPRVLSAAPACASVGHTATPEKKRPNVILVMTDDQGYGDLACHGNSIIKTPNLDELHAQSTRLTNFHVGPTCSPTRASLMTGRYCNRTGVWHTVMGRSLLRKDEVTMADVFRAGGYKTGIFGKWHLGDSYPFRPQDRGFDEVLIHKGGGIGNTQDYWGNDYFDDTYFRNGRPEKFEGYCTDVWFAEATKFIEANKDRPFFCYLPTNAPHGPFRVPEKYAEPYMGKGVKFRFYGMISNIDENMGRLMAKLKALGIEDNTILIFMTDNGSSGGYLVYNAGMRGGKGSEYDGGHRVPFFMRWPGGQIKAAVDIERITAHVDILPTLIELCGLQAPEDVKFDGASLVPLLTGDDQTWPKRTLITDSQRVNYPIKWRKSSVMTDRWRLVNGAELYDMTADPGQKNNVADRHPELVASLRDEYEDWWTDTSKRFHEYCDIIIGADEENPSMLTSHDWHSHGPWNQTQVLKGQKENSFWAVEVALDGEYEIALRRWPQQVNAPITAAIPKGEAIRITKARLKIADVDQTQPVLENATAVKFKVRLKAGKTRLQTWFIDQDDESKSLGAYYVYVKRLDG